MNVNSLLCVKYLIQNKIRYLFILLKIYSKKIDISVYLQNNIWLKKKL